MDNQQLWSRFDLKSRLFGKVTLAKICFLFPHNSSVEGVTESCWQRGIVGLAIPNENREFVSCPLGLTQFYFYYITPWFLPSKSCNVSNQLRSIQRSVRSCPFEMHIELIYFVYKIYSFLRVFQVPDWQDCRV